jgi:hypothetical protein
MILMMYVDNNLVKTTKYVRLLVPFKRLTLILCSTITV